MTLLDFLLRSQHRKAGQALDAPALTRWSAQGCHHSITRFWNNQIKTSLMGLSLFQILTWFDFLLFILVSLFTKHWPFLTCNTHYRLTELLSLTWNILIQTFYIKNLIISYSKFKIFSWFQSEFKYPFLLFFYLNTSFLLFISLVLTCIQSVSYTHLDVYKRQVMNSSKNYIKFKVE